MPEAEDHSARDESSENARFLDIDDPTYSAEAFDGNVKPTNVATPEIAAAWSVEIERRAQACARGEMLTADWREAMARLRKRGNRTG